ncbi:hypothetical protein AB0O07_33180 [Streptomyces sp. NPDC093085]|uniref:hypothetical protein n=1 Tax=Streptomyces sp. NPDC093085 TaxID=3155068 RepID=UPI003442DEFB
MSQRHLLRTTAVSLALALSATAFAAGSASAAPPASAHAAGAPVRTAPADVSAAATGWEVSLSGPSAAESLMSVSSVSDDLAWAAGRSGGKGVIMRWDGSAWAEETAPGLPAVWQWSAVSAVSADDVWAYGTLVRDQVLAHYDGTRWSAVPTVGPSDDSWPEVPIAAVPGRLFKGGNGLYTYTDGAWTTFELPARVDIRDIVALSADDAYATGMRYPVNGGHPVTYHWDGTTWTLLPQAPVRAGTDTAKIAADGPDSVYVAGWADGSGGGAPIPSVAHWDGTGWTDITGALTELYLHAIVPDGDGGLWAAGTDKAHPAYAEPVFWHFDGATWSKEAGAPTPDSDPARPGYTFYDLAPVSGGTTAGPGSGGFWAVGDYSLPLDSNGDQTVRALIERSVTLR